MRNEFTNANWKNRLQKTLGLGPQAQAATASDTGVCESEHKDPVRVVSAGLLTPDPDYTSLPPECLVGRSIKVPFQTGENPVEHMWVTVTGFNGNTLIGKLDSDPVVTDDLKYGDEVQVSRRSIVAVHLTFREWSKLADALRRTSDYWNCWLGSPIGRRFDSFYHKGFSPRQALLWWRDFESHEED
jgi:hypothetical protein